MSTNSQNSDLRILRERLDGRSGPEYWRSLEEVADTPEFRRFLEAEMPSALDDVALAHGRRDFLKLMGASFGLAGLSACVKQPEEKIVPYVRAPEDLIPGKAKRYATALVRSGYATGVLVESHMGRPTHIEGNPQHPASLGAVDVFQQAEILRLYDPDRSQSVRQRGAINTWKRFLDGVLPVLEGLREKRGRGLAILTGRITSPTLAAQLAALREKYPEIRLHRWDPVHRDSVAEGSRLAFGKPYETQYRLQEAQVVLSADADFMFSMPGSLQYARHFMAGRSWEWKSGEGFRRLYAVESAPTVTGSVADHRFRARASDIGGWLAELAAELAVPGVARAAGVSNADIAEVAKDLLAHRGRSVVIPGDAQPAEVHALAHAINAHLGNVGRTVVYTRPVEEAPESATKSIAELADAMSKDQVEVLFFLDTNPVYDAPAELDLVAKLEKVPLRVHLGLYEDETGRQCHWHLPMRHALETWTDARAFDGTVTLAQPLIAPLYNGRSIHEMVAMVGGEVGAKDHDVVRAHWRGAKGEADFEAWWRRSLHDGFVADSAFTTIEPSLVSGDWNVPRAAEGLELVFAPDPTVWDGTFANSGWLQELPKPMTKLAWDNAALVSPRTAETLGVSNGAVVQLSHEGRALEAAVWILPGQADDSVQLTLGYGRRRAGRVGDDRGFDAYQLRTGAAQWIANGVTVKPTGARYPLVTTQDHHSMEGRGLVRQSSLVDYVKNQAFAREPDQHMKKLSLYPEWEYEGTQWGMSINLNSCIGCNACVIACQSENNIPVVGKEQVANGREMHWIRVDRYFEGSLDEPEIHNQPVTCMHCENAPCEYVCPVNATVHSPDGLNQMVYNRCVGTRYCANNCPYKVRRFNFLLYSDWDTKSLKPMRNPDVTVRSRGVMEKCTYCVQRINEARIEAKKGDRDLKEGEVVTACQSSCPTQAIAFGLVSDPSSPVSRQKASPLSYSLLDDLNTKPRTTYLAKLRSPNAALAVSKKKGEG